ncbi:MAG: VIT1/CCC1 transporter family protein [Treponemataceae bacterium]|nr:MAG: VIT1/CCC1 transporter family protein [Treponemataceae bacterium]
MELSKESFDAILVMQQNELTESVIYERIAAFVKDAREKKTLLKIALEEKNHAGLWARYTMRGARVKRGKIFWAVLLARVLGYTFVLKKMENGEQSAQINYARLIAEVPEAGGICDDDRKHEQELIGILDDERLQYAGAMMLGLSDALVELTGTLAGLSFALANNRLIALSGLITGISATLSMTASQFLSARSDGHPHPFKSSLYTGGVYLFTVTCLTLPYLLLPVRAWRSALCIDAAIVLATIFCFTYYISVAKGYSFKRRFAEMAGISLGVAAVSFVIGLAVKNLLGIDV